MMYCFQITIFLLHPAPQIRYLLKQAEANLPMDISVKRAIILLNSALDDLKPASVEPFFVNTGLLAYTAASTRDQVIKYSVLHD